MPLNFGWTRTPQRQEGAEAPGVDPSVASPDLRLATAGATGAGQRAMAANNADGRRNVCDIYCIGAQKSATSWLHHVINVHPDAYIFPNSKPVTSTNKEAHFWDWNKKRGVDWYRKLLAPDRPDQKSMDFTPEYALMASKDIEQCRELSPDAKILYVLREPVCRAMSALRMHYLWEGLFTSVKFDNFLAHIYRKARIREHSQYVRNYKKWEKVFGGGRIKVINYDDVLADPNRIVRDVQAFLDLDPSKMTGPQEEELKRRIEKRVWKSEQYEVDDLTMFFLNECLGEARTASEKFFGLKFTETPNRSRASE